MANYRVVGNIIHGLKSMNSILSSMIGEDSKLGIHTSFNWDFNLKDKDPTRISWDNVPELIKNTREESTPELQIIFLGIVALINTDTNEGYSVNKAWWDPKVKSISDNGIRFIHLKDALEQLDYKVEVDDNLFVKSVSHESSKDIKNANNNNE